jgi:ankyrin repeat protein
MFSSFAELLTGKKREFRDAAETGNFDKVKRLLLAGQDVNSTSDYGATALSKASARGELDMVKFLLTIEGVDVHMVHKGRRNALQEAIIQGESAPSDFIILDY